MKMCWSVKSYRPIILITNWHRGYRNIRQWWCWAYQTYTTNKSWQSNIVIKCIHVFKIGASILSSKYQWKTIARGGCRLSCINQKHHHEDYFLIMLRDRCFNESWFNNFHIDEFSDKFYNIRKIIKTSTRI